jgi:hypothetical protein
LKPLEVGGLDAWIAHAAQGCNIPGQDDLALTRAAVLAHALPAVVANRQVTIIGKLVDHLLIGAVALLAFVAHIGVVDVLTLLRS